MRLVLLTIATVLGIVLSSSRIHQLLLTESSLSKIEFFVILFLLILNIITIYGIYFIYKNLISKIQKIKENNKKKLKKELESELKSIGHYITDLLEENTTITEKLFTIDNRIDQLFLELVKLKN